MLIKVKLGDNCDHEKNDNLLWRCELIQQRLTEQLRYHERKKEQCLEKGRRNCVENKERLQKIACNRYTRLCEEEKKQEQNMQEINII